MRQFKVRRLPVIDPSGQLQGVISVNDLVLTTDQHGIPSAAELISTMAAICAHRSVETEQ
jgi:CBS domain-containing protein